MGTFSQSNVRDEVGDRDGARCLACLLMPAGEVSPKDLFAHEASLNLACSLSIAA